MAVALVTGIAGQTGSYLAERLLDAGWEVHGVARDVDRSAFCSGDALLRSVIHSGDLADRTAMDRIIREVQPDSIYNLAGISSVAASWEHPTLVSKVNGLAVASLLASTAEYRERTGRDVSFVQASSAEIFGHPMETPQTENTPVAPTNPYGAAKAYAHHLISVYRGSGLRASSCILYNHESPRRPLSFVTRKITNGAARIALGLDDKILLGNIFAERDWGWAPDYADALFRASQHNTGGDFVIATGISHSIRDFAEAAFRSAGILDWESRVEVSKEFMRPNDAPALVGDASRAARELGWVPTKSFEEIVEIMVEHDLAVTRAAN